MWGRRRIKCGLFTHITGKAGKSRHQTEGSLNEGKRDLKTAQKQRERIKGPGISYDRTATDGWDGFLSAFREENHAAGKEQTAGIEGNNCRLRRRIRRALRRTCCFSKKLFNHGKAFETAFFYINYGFV
jgi:IS1 family transposase